MRRPGHFIPDGPSHIAATICLLKCSRVWHCRCIFAMLPLMKIVSVAALAVVFSFARGVQAQTDLPRPLPVPRAQAVPLPNREISFQRDGFEIARYYYGTHLDRPFLYPVIGPAGRSLTRMGHPHDPETHSHHNSIWISHRDVSGTNFWADHGHGKIIHQRVLRFDDGPDRASVLVVNAWTADTGKVLLREWRQMSVELLPNDEWLLVLDLEFEAPGPGKIILGKTPFGLIGVRMARSIGVNDGGGRIRNSEGAAGEKEILWKPAKWVDYSGPITDRAIEGVTLMDHPNNPNHPSVFHVRSDGWMGASLTFDEPRTLAPGEPLRLRYGLYIHAGMPAIDALQKQWKEFAGTSLPNLKPQKSK